MGRYLAHQVTGPGKVQSRLATVGRETISAEVVERGIVRPARITPISSRISSNQAKIVWLIDEGAKVRKGDLVAKFDTKPFVDALHKAEQLYADAEATYFASQKLLKLQEEEEEGKTEEAVRKVEIAEIKAGNIKKGSGPLKRKTLVQKLKQEERTLAICKNELADMKTLLKKGHVSSREKDKAKDKVITAEEKVAVARAEIENFDNYLWPQMLREAELLVNAAHSDLERVKRTGELLIQNRAAEMEKNRRIKEARKASLSRAQADIESCDVFAPTDGILLFTEIPKNNKRYKVHIGDSVWFGQTFMEVPDTSELIAEIQVREIDVAKITSEMDVVLQVDAFPGREFKGKVLSVASLAEEDQNIQGLRRFLTRIRLVGDIKNVHVGMSVTARIRYKTVTDVVAVPISSLHYSEDFPFVYRVSGTNREKVKVTLGLQGSQVVEVVDGLVPGDIVSLDVL